MASCCLALFHKDAQTGRDRARSRIYRESYLSLLNSANKQLQRTLLAALTGWLYNCGDQDREAKKDQARCARKTWFFETTSL